MTSFPDPRSPTSGLSATYDAWNRLVEVKNSSNTVITANEYDGLNRRIVRDETGAGGDKRHFYYNQQWQVLEERVEVSGTINPNPVNQYVWHPYYVDALAVRYYDENTDGAGIVRHWYTQDANFNVTAVANDSGTVLERYSYTPYGEVTFLNPDFSVKVSQTSAIGNNYLYTGRERDPETGLQLNRNRFYHPGLGRWLTQDPIGYVDGLNLYGAYFVPNGLDPSGTRKICCGFSSGWVIKEEFGRTIDCADGRSRAECCGEFGAWPKLWKTISSAEGPCDQKDPPWAVALLTPVAKPVAKSKLAKRNPATIGLTIAAAGIILKGLEEACPKDFDEGCTFADCDAGKPCGESGTRSCQWWTKPGGGEHCGCYAGGGPDDL